MTQDIETSNRQPTVEDTPSGTGQGLAGGVSSLQARVAAIADERPEAAVGAAFAGGLVLALILKRVAR